MQMEAEAIVLEHGAQKALSERCEPGAVREGASVVGTGAKANQAADSGFI